MKIEDIKEDLILIAVLVVLLIVVPDLKLNSAIKDVKNYLGAVNKLESYDSSMSNLVDETSKVRKELNSTRTNKDVDIQDIVSIYNGITALKGVDKNIDASLIRVTSSVPKEIGTYDPENTANVSNADGIKLTLNVEDIDSFLAEFEKLQIPTMSLNVIYPEKKVVIVVNTQ